MSIRVQVSLRCIFYCLEFHSCCTIATHFGKPIVVHFRKSISIKDNVVVT